MSARISVVLCSVVLVAVFVPAMQTFLFARRENGENCEYAIPVDIELTIRDQQTGVVIYSYTENSYADGACFDAWTGVKCHTTQVGYTKCATEVSAGQPPEPPQLNLLLCVVFVSN